MATKKRLGSTYTATPVKGPRTVRDADRNGSPAAAAPRQRPAPAKVVTSVTMAPRRGVSSYTAAPVGTPRTVRSKKKK